jgi:hypothetical protein
LSLKKGNIFSSKKPFFCRKIVIGVDADKQIKLSFVKCQLICIFVYGDDLIFRAPVAKALRIILCGDSKIIRIDFSSRFFCNGKAR